MPVAMTTPALVSGAAGSHPRPLHTTLIHGNGPDGEATAIVRTWTRAAGDACGLCGLCVKSRAGFRVVDPETGGGTGAYVCTVAVEGIVSADEAPLLTLP